MTRFKKKTAALLCGAALFFAPSLVSAEPVVSGDVAVYGGSLAVYNDADGDNFNNGMIAGFNARMKRDMLQLDINAEYVNAGFGYDYTAKGAALHVMAPTADQSMGLMVAVGSDGPGDVTVGGAPYFTFAVEGAKKIGSSTFDTQIGYFAPKDEDYIDSGYYAYLGSSTPLSAYLNLNLHVQGVRMAEAGGHDYSYVQAISYGALLEFSESENLTVYGGFLGSHTSESSESEKWGDASAVIGIRVPFGGTNDKPVFADHNPLTGVNHIRLNDWQ